MGFVFVAHCCFCTFIRNIYIVGVAIDFCSDCTFVHKRGYKIFMEKSYFCHFFIESYAEYL